MRSILKNLAVPQLLDLLDGRDAEIAREELVCRFDSLIRATVIKTLRRYSGTNGDLLEEMVQETYVRIFQDGCRRLRDCRGPDAGSMFGLVKAIAFSTVIDRFRNLNAERRGGAVVEISLSDHEGGVIVEGVRSTDHDLLLRQIEDCLKEVVPHETLVRDRQIFLLYYRQGFSARDISLIPAISLTVKGVESVILRITRDLKQHLNSAPHGERVSR
jgi:RNA polymerase sigma-70 factor, ECF subfamily